MFYAERTSAKSQVQKIARYVQESPKRSLWPDGRVSEGERQGGRGKKQRQKWALYGGAGGGLYTKGKAELLKN